MKASLSKSNSSKQRPVEHRVETRPAGRATDAEPAWGQAPKSIRPDDEPQGQPLAQTAPETTKAAPVAPSTKPVGSLTQPPSAASKDRQESSPATMQAISEFLLDCPPDVDRLFRDFLRSAPDDLFEQFKNNHPLLWQKHPNKQGLSAKEHALATPGLMDTFTILMKQQSGVVQLFIKEQPAVSQHVHKDIGEEFRMVKGFLAKRPDVTEKLTKLLGIDVSTLQDADLESEYRVIRSLKQMLEDDKELEQNYEDHILTQGDAIIYQEFLNEHPEFKKLYERSQMTGQQKKTIQEYIDSSTTASKKFKEFKAKHAEKFGVKAFVQSKSNLRRKYDWMKQQGGEKAPLTYERIEQSCI